MARTRLSLPTFVALCGLCAVAGAVDWPGPVWGPQDGLEVHLSQVRFEKVSVLDALEVLDNNCGLLFGYACEGDGPVQQPAVDLALNDVTVRQVLEELQRLAPGYNFEFHSDVVTVWPQDRKPAFLAEPVDSFSAIGVSRRDLRHRLLQFLKGVKGFGPPGVSFERMEPPSSGITVEAAGVPVLELLTRSTLASGYSWIYRVIGDRASFALGRGWALRMGLREAVTLAPGAPKEPLAGGPPPAEVVVQRVEAAVGETIKALHNADAAVEGLAELLDDRYAREFAGGRLADGMRAIGQLRSVEGAAILAKYADYTGHGMIPLTEFMKGYVQGSDPKLDRKQACRGAYLTWLGDYIAMPALVSIGQPAVEPIVAALAEHDGDPTRREGEPPDEPDRRQAKVIVLCEALAGILGTEDAVARLREAADKEKEAERSKRLSDAAARIEKGLVPEL